MKTKNKVTFGYKKEVKNKNKEKINNRKIVPAHPQVIMMAQIMIMDEEKPIAVGGFSVDGGFYLREGFNLVRQKNKSVNGEILTYFNFVKEPKKKGVMERLLIKHKKEQLAYERKREKTLREELQQIEKNKEKK
jgi:hypothetical protein